MLRKIKRFLGLNIIEWVENTKKEYDHLEADKFLLVENKTTGPLFFTTSQIARAKKRAKDNQEDL